MVVRRQAFWAARGAAGRVGGYGGLTTLQECAAVTERERGFSVRPADEDDIPVLADVQLRTALSAYADIFPPEAPAPTIEEYLDNWSHRLARQDDGVGVFVAVEKADPTILGLVMADPEPEIDGEGVAHGNLRGLYVDPDHWGVGIGRRLHDTAREFLRVSRPFLHTISLWVMEQNTNARARYEDWGWQQTLDRQEIYPGIEELRYVAKQ